MIQSIFHLEHYIAYLFSFINLGIFAQFSWQNPWKGWSKANEDEQSRGTLRLYPKIFTIFDLVRIYTDCGFINLSMERTERRGDDRAELQHCRRLFYFRLIFRSFNLGSENVLRKLFFYTAFLLWKNVMATYAPHCSLLMFTYSLGKHQRGLWFQTFHRVLQKIL